MGNPIKNMIISEVFRQEIVGTLRINLNETDYKTDVLPKYEALSKRAKIQLIKTVNVIFLNNISATDKALVKYAEKNFIRSEALTLDLYRYVYDGKSSFEDLVKIYQKIFFNYLIEKIISPSGYFGNKALISGDEYVDDIIVRAIFSSIKKDLYSSSTMLSMDSVRIKTALEDFAKTNLNPIEDQLISKRFLKEGFSDLVRKKRFLGAIQIIFNKFNGASLKSIENTLKTLDAIDAKLLQKGGKSNIAKIVSVSLINRTAEVLKKIKLKDNNLDLILELISIKLMAKNSVLFKTLYGDIYEYIQERLNTLRNSKDTINQINYKLANYGEWRSKNRPAP